MTKETQIIPFGKYKGQPLEVLQNDKQYVEWLRNQSWFIQNHPTINTLIINNFSEASDSPEHNRLQARFLDDDFCQKFLNTQIFDEEKEYRREKIKTDYFYTDYKVQKAVFELNNIDVIICYSYRRYSMTKEKVREYKYEKKSNEFIPRINDLKGSSDDPTYEDLIIIYGEVSKSEDRLKIELKPSIGDDYPSILRKILADKKCDYCVAENYSGTGATKEQVIEIFKRAGIKLIFLPDIGL